MSKKYTVVVVGGGHAGVTAANRCIFQVVHRDDVATRFRKPGSFSWSSSVSGERRVGQEMRDQIPA